MACHESTLESYATAHFRRVHLYLPSYATIPYPPLHRTEQSPEAKLQPLLVKVMYTLLPTCGLVGLFGYLSTKILIHTNTDPHKC